MGIQHLSNLPKDGWTPQSPHIPGWITLSHPGGGLCLRPNLQSRLMSFVIGAVCSAFGLVGLGFFAALTMRPSWIGAEVPAWWPFAMGVCLIPGLLAVTVQGFRAMLGTTILIADHSAITVRRTLLWYVEEQRYPGQVALRIVRQTVGKGGRLIQLEIRGADASASPASITFFEFMLDYVFDRLRQNHHTLQISEKQAKPLAKALSRATGRKVINS